LRLSDDVWSLSVFIPTAIIFRQFCLAIFRSQFAIPISHFDRQGFPIKIENKVVKSYFKVTKLKKVNEYATLSRR